MHSKVLKTTALIATIILSSLALPGCWSSLELNQISIVMGLGVDAAAGGGFEVTAQIARPALLSSDAGGSSGEAYFNAKQTAPAIFTALRGLMDMFSRRLYTQQCEVLIVGADVARNDISTALEYFLRNEESRMTMPLLIADGLASEVLDEVTYLEAMPSIQLAQMADNQKYTGRTSRMTVFGFLRDMLAESIDPTAPIVELFTDEHGETKARISGTAVFKDNRMVGVLSSEEVYGMLLVNGQLHTGVMHITGLGGLIELEIVDSQTSVRPVLANGAFSAEITVHVECAIVYTTSTASINEVKEGLVIGELAQRELENRIMIAVDAARKLNADVFGFGQMARQRYPHAYDELPGGWYPVFQTMPIKTDIQVYVTGTGAIQRPLRTAYDGQVSGDEQKD